MISRTGAPHEGQVLVSRGAPVISNRAAHDSRVCHPTLPALQMRCNEVGDTYHEPANQNSRNNGSLLLL